MQLLGGYYWRALLADGQVIDQVYINEDGQETERSVDHLRKLLQPVKEIHLIPLNRATHAPIVLDIQDDQDWLKYWVRTVVINPVTDEVTQQPTIDALGLLPKVGSRSRKPLRAFVYPDGSILLTTRREP